MFDVPLLCPADDSEQHNPKNPELLTPETVFALCQGRLDDLAFGDFFPE
ncbi:hypothetical protein RGV33_33075 [Pseudomonas sp. Bout1]|nr:hypothetical protein [Pseudomonas sp. Bout1]MDY7536455.1 hypothetical protein [Pseudomonas sp. Bout1]MEB0187481.1 hypothetical protein [Pseudomonas sp. Bout1]